MLSTTARRKAYCLPMDVLLNVHAALFQFYLLCSYTLPSSHVEYDKYSRALIKEEPHKHA